MPHRRPLLLVLLLALLVAGCGGATTEAGPASPKKSASTSAAPSKAAEPAPDPGYGVPEVGQCTRMTFRQSRATVARGRKVSCRSPHTSVVAHVAYLPRPVTARSPLQQLRKVGNRLCAPAYRRVAGGTLADRATSILTWTLFTPSQAQLERGARWVRCDVIAPSGSSLVPLPAGRTLLAQGVPEQLRVCQTEAGQDISCGQPHAFRVEAVYRAVGEAYPDATTYAAVARSRCQELTKAPGGFWQPPGESGWKAGDRFIRCLTAAAP
jgi:hypothetical protein